MQTILSDKISLTSCVISSLHDMRFVVEEYCRGVLRLYNKSEIKPAAKDKACSVQALSGLVVGST